ncbi:carboxypeptidase-like regulatory domain-containing protein [Winogradskyella endarachnes]|uniref:Carboxypeptidase-like regulatory domain-containing protein n=1 Tax=Winogradskyella endarachnes TaxID=2681965 RepID=A0A6L6U641_9FLAO|nr:carboxypeptidase-like regulatory domain-containing protein [Winogradskyella endarachnes]MUU77379.1 hypothetical protein [Winogradskyella endarachnes]
MKYYTVIILVLIHLTISSQTLKGKISDSLTHEALSYVNISIKDKRIGVYSDENGGYKFNLSKTTVKDTLIISYIGYKKQKLAVSKFQENKEYQLNLELTSKTEPLKEILIHSNPKNFSKNSTQLSTGNRNQTFPLSQPYGSEVAIFIENPKNKYGKLTELHLKFKTIKDDKFLTYQTYYRIAFYNVDNLGFPGDLIHFENIIIKPETETKNLIVDLEEKGIPFSKIGMFIGIETIKPDFVKVESAMYLSAPSLIYTHTKSSKTYFRFRSNQWHKQRKTSVFKKKLFAVPFIKLKAVFEKE